MKKDDWLENRDSFKLSVYGVEQNFAINRLFLFFFLVIKGKNARLLSKLCNGEIKSTSPRQKVASADKVYTNKRSVFTNLTSNPV